MLDPEQLSCFQLVAAWFDVSGENVEHKR